MATRKPARKATKKPAKKTARKPAKKTTSRKATKKTTARKATKTKASSNTAEPTKKWKAAQKPKNGRTLSYTQGEFYENIAGFCGLMKRTEAKAVCEDISRFIQDSLKRGYRIPLMGLGKLYVRQTKARMGRNPATGETIRIPARKRVRFTPAKALKETVL